VIFQNFVRAIIKAVGHRYIKRIPYNTPKGRRYRYIYRVSSTHQGRHAFDAEHLVEGTAFALHGEGESEFHGHITDVKGDMIKYVIDDGPRKGEEVTTSRQRLVDELNLVHGVQDKLTAERAKVKAAIAEARRAGHTGVVRRLERRLRALGGEVEAQPAEPRASGVADLIEAHRVGLLERAGALKEQWGALDRQADKEEIARLRDEEGALRGAALLAARAQRDGVDGFGAELQKLIDRIQASIERSDDAEHKARLRRDLEQRRQLLAIVEGAKPEAQPAEPEPEAQPAEPVEQQERERQEARAPRAERDRFLETVTPEQAREDYHYTQVKGDLETIRNRRDELEGVDPVAITKAVKEPIPTDGAERTYTLPDGGRLTAHIDGDKLVYQYQFPSGAVSDKQEATLIDHRKMTDARLRKLAQGLAAAYHGEGENYYTPKTEHAIESHRAVVADVARLNKAERAFSTFDERTRETRVQRDALDPITPRSDAINSAEDIDKKTLAALKRTRSTDKIRTNMTQAGRAGDLLFATDGRRLFYRRGMNFGADNKVVAIDNKATPEQLDERPPGAGVLVDRVEGNTQHAGTMSKETAKHLADALEIAKGTGANSALFVRADGEKVAIIYKGRELASFPQAEGSESRGDYGVSADYFRDALLDGGSVSLYLHPENPRVDVEPMRLESMAGAHIIMPQRF